MYIYGHDYIKYLNDNSTRMLTYDQWKNKIRQQDSIQLNSARKAETTRHTVASHSSNSFRIQ